MGTLRAGTFARLRAETLGLRPTQEPVQTRERPDAVVVPPRPIPAPTPQRSGPSGDLLEAARLSRLAKEHCALIEAEDATALRALDVDSADVEKLLAWRRGLLEERRRRELWAMVRETFPAAFGNPASPIPLKIGIHRDLATEIGIADARRLLSYWCSRPQYYTGIVSGATRYALDGTPAGTVTETEVAAACRSPVQSVTSSDIQ